MNKAAVAMTWALVFVVVLAALALEGLPAVERFIEHYSPNQAEIIRAEGEAAIDKAAARAVDVNSNVMQLVFILLVVQGLMNTFGLVLIGLAITRIRQRVTQPTMAQVIPGRPDPCPLGENPYGVKVVPYSDLQTYGQNTYGQNTYGQNTYRQATLQDMRLRSKGG